MTEKFQPQGGIYEPGLDIPLNWSDMRSVFGYKVLCEIAHFSIYHIKSLYTQNIC
jgi:hypothetical protein